jgi:acyl phosphate:glycerol-3-phosphate acyltransferase
MNISLFVLAALVGYLAGSISFSRIVTYFISRNTDLSKVVIKDEVTGAEFQRRPSALSASMALGWKVGCAVSLMDMAKVTLPVLAIKLLLPEHPYFLVTAAAAVAGNNWPIFYRFHGGGGISAIYGGLLVIDPLAIVVPAVGGMVVGLLVLRKLVVMFILSLLLIIPWLWWRFADPAYWIYALVVNGMYQATIVAETLPFLKPGVRPISDQEIMQQMPMGRGMLKMLAFFKPQK